MKSLSIVVLLLVLSSCAAHAQDLGNIPTSLVPLKDINSDDNDYAPCVSPNSSTLYFSSGRGSSADVYTSSRVVSIQSTTSTQQIDDSRISAGRLFDTRSKGQTNWNAPMELSSFNSSQDEGCLSFSADGHTVVFDALRKDGVGDVDIYIADYKDGAITNERNLGTAVNTEYWDAQPCLSADGTTIYFSSNRPGGVGGTDIWMTKRLGDGSWSAPQCLDQNINTEQDERTPFLTRDGGTLVFASNGHAGFGGYDLFYSSRDVQSPQPDWTPATNLGGIVNSDNDELFFFSSAADDYFYISSSRNPDRKLDIFQGTPNLVGMGTVRLNISVIDTLSGKALPATVTIIDILSGAPLTTLSIGSDQAETVVSVPANRSYRISSLVAGYPERTQDVQPKPANAVESVRLVYGAVGFDFSNYQIPFFVTGYYRPNTTPNLESLQRERKQSLNGANYIEHFSDGSAAYERYASYAKVVDELFASVVHTGIDTVLPRFRSSAPAGEVLEISVVGYADPKPILGRYVESEDVSFVDANGKEQHVTQGDRLSNLSLSGLRAYYSTIELKRLFAEYAAQSGKTDYNELLNSGRLRFRSIGGGVNTNGNDYAAQRRIRIDFARAGTSATPLYDSNSIKK